MSYVSNKIITEECLKNAKGNRADRIKYTRYTKYTFYKVKLPGPSLFFFFGNNSIHAVN